MIPGPGQCLELEPTDIAPVAWFITDVPAGSRPDVEYFLKTLLDQGVAGRWYFFPEGGVHVRR